MARFIFRARREERRTGAYVHTRGFEHHSNAAMEIKMGVLDRYIELIPYLDNLHLTIRTIEAGSELIQANRAGFETSLHHSAIFLAPFSYPPFLLTTLKGLVPSVS